jgi:xanthine dehydrogenase accessory factor
VSAIDDLAKRLTEEDAMLVSVQATRGSVPRKKGAWMAVFMRGMVGTIGGGHLEFQALAEARQQLAGAPGESLMRYALGPSLGQCCGGDVQVRFARVAATDLTDLKQRLDVPGAPVALFGGGHVGHALVKVMGNLPLSVNWIDSRDEVFPDQVPANVVCEHSDPVQGAVASLAPGAQVLIMSFSHAEDLEVVAACLLRQRGRGDVPYIGLIGSRTKWAAFKHRLAARGFSEEELAHVTCPIGVPGIAGKAPEVIAVAVAAQILQNLPVQPGD